MFGSGAAKKQEKIRDGSEEFQKLATAIRKIKQTSNEEALKLYAHFKQAQFGDNEETAPGTFDFVGKAKHTAWLELKGTSPEDAEKEYLKFGPELLKKYLPEEYAALYPNGH